MNYGLYIIYALFNVRQTIYHVCFAFTQRERADVPVKAVCDWYLFYRE